MDLRRVRCLPCMFAILIGFLPAEGMCSEVGALRAQLDGLLAEKAAVVRALDERIRTVESELARAEGRPSSLMPSPKPPAAGSSEVKPASIPSKGFLDFNTYYDVEKYSVVTINAQAVLPNDLSYFSLTNYSNGFGAGDETEFDDFYTEQNLTWSPAATGPVGWNIQWNLRSGVNNDRLRLAPQWRLQDTPVIGPLLKQLRARYFINFHAVQWDDETHGDYVWQMEHVYRIDVLPELLDDRVYLAGFMDHTFGGPGNPAVVTEHQLGVRIIDRWYAIAEFRRNEYRKGREDSLGLGAEYIIRY